MSKEHMCGECWIENDSIICQHPEEHFTGEAPTAATDEQMDLFKPPKKA